LDEARCFAFFGGGVCSDAATAVLSGASASVVATTFDGSPADALAEGAAKTAVPGVAVVLGGIDVVSAAEGATVFGDAVDAVVGAAAFAAADVAGAGVVREDARASGLSLGGAAATETGGDAGFAGGVAVAGDDGGAGAVGATDGTAAAPTLVTLARAAAGVFSGSLGRSIRESTTPAPAVAPIAVATRTTRAVRAKLGAGAK
jgi:hypothetical protein